MNRLLIKKYYRKGIYSEKQLDVFVRAGYITAEEKQEIMEEK